MRHLLSNQLGRSLAVTSKKKIDVELQHKASRAIPVISLHEVRLGLSGERKVTKIGIYYNTLKSNGATSKNSSAEKRNMMENKYYFPYFDRMRK